MAEWLGWTATAVFTASYFCRHARSLRRVQMLGAILWSAYGILLHAWPVVGANLLLLMAAAATSMRQADAPVVH